MNALNNTFVDTNIFVYAFTNDEPSKQELATSALRNLMVHQTLRTSTQVLQELYITLTRKFSKAISPEEALQRVKSISRWRIVSISPEMIVTAATLCIGHQISFWDALIVVAAQYSGATHLLTEDLSHGQKIMGVEIVNPFLSRNLTALSQ